MSLKTPSKIYLDHNGTTPLLTEVKSAILESLDRNWANPSSSSIAGKIAKEDVERSRNELKELIDCPQDQDVIFTSGGTEANNWVIYSHMGLLNGDGITPSHVVTTNIEHDSVDLCLSHLEQLKLIEVTRVPVSTETGSVAAEDIVKAVQPNTVLVTVMLANNETGVLQPLTEIVRMLRAAKIDVPVHTDAAQAIGKVPVSVANLGVDYMTIVGHKFYGPRIGALYARSKSRLQPLFFGGGQEYGLRPGTENTAMIVGLGKAANIAKIRGEVWMGHMEDMSSYLETRLKEVLGSDRILVNYKPGDRTLPNTRSISFPKMDLTAVDLLSRCDKFVAATGAACHSNKTCASTILLKSGVTEHIALRTIRFSVGIDTTQEQIDVVVEEIRTVLA